mmetsp:Transcript_34098/g.96653  ORF Transcript_34098/g.96653 Transcript_34098/m.96653 type:complete len:508 (+) Transcript_34098:160-1683(+)|eukprot:CAMPEP_0117675818 /NCGR_PEP_ID=MMETSP0804-20121206/15820_1 /TAXON_ID=1074897 /ORGANISM="Tetraselmis astigmatica, Strain CCMP880" /LENGTH=507 /DNA_ID=CAMNT_0005484871 /DNA_START=145 /DNA_END=1668 /DNA_ORIENTATION=-
MTMHPTARVGMWGMLLALALGPMHFPTATVAENVAAENFGSASLLDAEALQSQAELREQWAVPLDAMTPVPGPLRTCAALPEGAATTSGKGHREAARGLPRLQNSKRSDLLRKPFLENALPGTSADRYETEDLSLGHGRHGHVALARDKETGEQVAIKRCKLKDLAYEVAMLHVFQNSGGVVKVKDVLPIRHYSGDGYVVMEILDGQAGTIADLWGGAAQVPSNDMRMLLLNLVIGVHHFHKNFVLHRDVSSQNVFFQREGCGIKLLDLGKALAHDPTTEVFPVYGHEIYGYKSPEWHQPYSSKHNRQRGYITWERGVQAEMFSVGVLMLSVLVGKDAYELYRARRLAFDGKNYSTSRQLAMFDLAIDLLGQPSPELMERHYIREKFAHKPKLPVFPLRAAFPEVDADSMDLVEGLMNLDPDQRPTTWDLLRHPYFADVCDASAMNGNCTAAVTDVDRRVRQIMQDKSLFTREEARTTQSNNKIYQEIVKLYQHKTAQDLSLPDRDN